MGPASSREQIGEQIGDDDGLQIKAKPTANNIAVFCVIQFAFVRQDNRRITVEAWTFETREMGLPLRSYRFLSSFRHCITRAVESHGCSLLKDYISRPLYRRSSSNRNILRIFGTSGRAHRLEPLYLSIGRQ